MVTRVPGPRFNTDHIHDWPARRMETARISLECTPGSRLTVREAENGARPGYRWFCTDKFALGALKTGSDFPGRSTCIGGRTPAQGTDPPKCLGGAQRAQWPTSIAMVAAYHPSPRPLRNPMCRDRSVRAPRAMGESGYESGWAYRAAAAPPICTKPLGRRFRSFFGPATRPPSWARGSGRRWAPAGLGPTRRGRRSPDIHSGLVRAVFVRVRARSCVSFEGAYTGGGGIQPTTTCIHQGCGRRGPWANPGGPIKRLGHLRFVPSPF
jgi:hypothetical protein